VQETYLPPRVWAPSFPHRLRPPRSHRLFMRDGGLVAWRRLSLLLPNSSKYLHERRLYIPSSRPLNTARRRARIAIYSAGRRARIAGRRAWIARNAFSGRKVDQPAKSRDRQRRPLGIFPVRIPELGTAEILITPCPGRLRRDLGLDLDQLRLAGAEAVVTLVEQYELKMLEVVDFGLQTERRGMTWLHCPIPDFEEPGAAFEEAWAKAGKQARGILKAGGKLGIHCHGGLGRAGTVASRLLVELGVATPEEALLRVRSARPGAVQTRQQERHVLRCRPLVNP